MSCSCKDLPIHQLSETPRNECSALSSFLCYYSLSHLSRHPVFAGSTHFPPSAQLLSISRALRDLTAPGSLEQEEKRNATVLTSPREPGTAGNRWNKHPSSLLGSWMASEDLLLPSMQGLKMTAHPYITLCLGAGLGTPPHPPLSSSSDNTLMAGGHREGGTTPTPEP